MPEYQQVDSEADTRALIERTRDGDLGALEVLFRRHSAEVFRVAFHLMGSADGADDVVQDVFIGLPEALRHLTAEAKLGPWIRRVAARTALMRLRSERRRRQAPLDAAGEARSPGGGILEGMALTEAIASLPAEMRVVFVLKEVEGYSHGEIAAMLGISVANSEIRLHRARQRLRASLGG